MAALCVAMLAGCASDVPGSSHNPAFFREDDPRVPQQGWSHVNDYGSRSDDAEAPVPAAIRDDGAWPFPVFGQPTVIQESTGREMSLAIDPNDPDRLLACSPTGTLVVGFGYSDVWLSLDAGQSWELLNPEPDTDTRSVMREGGDCDVAIGPDGTLWLVDSWLGGLSMGRSADGKSWTGTSLAAPVPVADRPWIQVDGAGVVHMTYQDVQFSMPSVIWYTSTTDGVLFSPPVVVAAASPDGAFTWTGDFSVSDDGVELASVYTRRSSVIGVGMQAEQVWVATSTDGGASWSNTLISQREGPASFLYPSLDRDAAGGLHVVFSEDLGRTQPTFYTTSTDGGASWSEPFALVDDVVSGAPWVAAQEPGHAVVLFSGSRGGASTTGEADWYFYWARVNATEALVATTTAVPLFSGPQPIFPEFNMIAVDSLGRAHIVAVAPAEHESGEFLMWRPYHQLQVAGPTL